MTMSSLYLLAIFASPALSFYVLVQLLAISRRRKVCAQYGCGNVKRIASKDVFLGLDTLLRISNEMRHNVHLPESCQRFEQYGNTYAVRLCGSITLFTCEKENIKAILATQFKSFRYGRRRRWALERLVGPGIFSSDGEQWQISRHLLKPTFSNISDTEFLEQHVQNLVQRIDSQQLRQDHVDLQQLFKRFTLDTTTELLLGQSCYSLLDLDRPQNSNEFGPAFDRLESRVTRDFVLGPLGGFRTSAEEKKDHHTVYRFVDRYVQRVLAANRTGPTNQGNSEDLHSTQNLSTIEGLAELTTDRHVLRSQVLNVLAAGRGTTTSLLSSLWFTMARRPDLYSRLRKEVISLEGSFPGFAQLKDMKFLQACLREIWLYEALRLYPPIPINQRTAQQDTMLPLGGGDDGKSPILVTAGTSVAYNIYALHRRADIWGADALEFRPDRWDDRKVGWEWLPFNGGPRLCLGQQFALTEAGYATVRLAQRYSRVEPHKADEIWQGYLGLAVTIPQGVKVSMCK